MSSPNPHISQAEIAERAFILWEQAGRPDGRDLEFWLRAEYSLTIERARPDAGASMPSSEDVPGKQRPPDTVAQPAARVKPATRGRPGAKG